MKQNALNKEKIEIAKNKMISVISRLSSTQDGRVLLNYLCIETGFALPSTVVTTTGKVDIEATFYNNARRDVYLRLRQFMTPEVIMAVELQFKHEEEVPKNAGS